jgi:uncharacterized protein YndB with AHSA1/START domain
MKTATMNDTSVIHHTFVIERNYSAPLEKVFAAFADPAKKRRWYLAGRGHESAELEMDFRVGGIERATYHFREGSPFPGRTLSNFGSYADIVPNRRVVEASTMSIDDRHISCSLVTLEFLPAGDGTNLICTHQGAFFEGSGGTEMREAGWRQLFDQLGNELAG